MSSPPLDNFLATVWPHYGPRGRCWNS